MTILHRISQEFPLLLRSPGGDEGGAPGGSSPSSGGGSSGSSGAPSSSPSGAPASSPSSGSSSSPAPGSSPPSAAPSPAPAQQSRSAESAPPPSSPPPGPTSLPDGSDDGAGDPFNFDTIFTVRDPLTELTQPEPAAPATQQPQQPPQPAAPEAPPQVAPAAPTAASQAPPPAVQSTQSPPSVVLSDPESLSTALRQNEAAAIEHIAQNAFALSQQEIEALEADVVGTLPKLMAKVMVKTQQSFFSNLGKIVPAMLQAHNQSATRVKEAEDQFFGAWPDLAKPELKDVVARTAKAFRMANPQMPREQMIKEVGIIVSHMAGVPLRQQNAQPGTQPAAPAANGHRPVQPSPWVPAGAAPAAGGTVEEGSPWDILGQSEG